MSRPILIKGSTKKAAAISIVLLSVALLCLGIVMVVASAQQVAGAALALVGVAGGTAGVIYHLFQVRGRVFLEVLDDGFVVSDRRGETEHLDEEVRAMATDLKQVHANGVATGVRRQALLRIGRRGVGERVEMDYTFPLGNVCDPLAGLFDRLQEMLLVRFREQIATGDKVDGDNWHLDQDGLTMHEGERDALHLYDELAAVSVVDHKVNVWERGQAEASIKIPLKTANAWALVPLLNDRLPQGTGEEEDVGDGMGRVIFERNKSWRLAGSIVAYVIACVLILIGLLVVAIVLVNGEGAAAVVGLLMIGFGVLLAVAAYLNRVNLFRAHALGVTRITASGKKELRYDEVGSFTWQATRQYVNGAYTGTTMKLAFKPRSGVDAPAITFNTSIKGSDDEIDNLRDFVSRIIAARWLVALQQGRSVPWTAGTVFHPDGLEHKKGWMGGTKILPYSAVLNYNFKDGWCYLFGAASSKALVQEAVNQANFFPGFALLLMILAQGGSVDAADAKPREDRETPGKRDTRPNIRRAEDEDEDEDERDEGRTRKRRSSDDDY